MAVTAQMIKELREITGAGMLDCKKALEETNGNIDAAVDLLREKGQAQAAKKQSRIAAEGLASVVIKDNEAVVFELNSETDFVAKNKEFLNLVETVGNIILNSNANNTEEALEVVNNGESLATLLSNATAKIGEKITLRRVSRVVKETGQGFGSYLHQGGTIAVLTVLAKEDEVVAKDIAMHVAAQNPRYLNSSQVEQSVLDHEKHILTEQALGEGKPADIVEKMVIGRLNKFLKDICLLDQPFVKDSDLTVSKYAKQNGNEVLSYIRLGVGEGIEKRNEDFAAEVAAQLGK